MINVTANTVVVSLSMSNANSAYRIFDVPEIKAGRTATGVDVEWLNWRSAYSVRAYQATGTRNNFSNIQNVSMQEGITFTHTGAQAGRAYKYKVSYFVTGNIGGSLVEHEGTRCAPVYLLEEQE